MHVKSVWLSALVLIALAVPVTARAQAPDEGRIVNVNIGGGFSLLSGDTNSQFGTAGNFQIGAIFNVTPMIGIQANYGYNRFGSKDIPQNLAGRFVTSIPLTANSSMHDGDFNVLVHGGTARRARPYGLAGLGVYHSIVNLTTPAIGVGTVCDPWLFICYPTPVAVDAIVGERTSTDFGFNVGGGVNVHIAGPASFYAEVKYIHTYGPSFTNPISGETIKANGNYWPFIFGFRL
jgi:opacity protein-like surface antigen